jgi:hypothetical protein
MTKRRDLQVTNRPRSPRFNHYPSKRGYSNLGNIAHESYDETRKRLKGNVQNYPGKPKSITSDMQDRQSMTIHTNAAIRKESNASSCHCVRLYCCKPILQIFYKGTNPKKNNNASSCHCVRLYCCKPILQIFYKDTKLNITNAPIRKKQRIVMSLRAFVLL